jgi:hypothetical protein
LPLLPRDYRSPLLFVVGDDLGLAVGPDDFHRASLRKALAAVVFVGIVPGVARRTFYGRAMQAALEARHLAALDPLERQLVLQEAAKLRDEEVVGAVLNAPRLIGLKLVASQNELDELRTAWNQGADPNRGAARADLAKLVKALGLGHVRSPGSRGR